MTEGHQGMCDEPGITYEQTINELKRQLFWTGILVDVKNDIISKQDLLLAEVVKVMEQYQTYSDGDESYNNDDVIALIAKIKGSLNGLSSKHSY